MGEGMRRPAAILAADGEGGERGKGDEGVEGALLLISCQGALLLISCPVRVLGSRDRGVELLWRETHGIAR